jgi:hypothetical protein
VEDFVGIKGNPSSNNGDYPIILPVFFRSQQQGICGQYGHHKPNPCYPG